MGKVLPLITKNWYSFFSIFCWLYVCTFFLAGRWSVGKSIDGMISAFEFLRITVVSDGLMPVREFIGQSPWPTIMGIVATLAVFYSAYVFVLYFENPPVGQLRILPVGFFVMSIFLAFDYVQPNIWVS